MNSSGGGDSDERDMGDSGSGGESIVILCEMSWVVVVSDVLLVE